MKRLAAIVAFGVVLAAIPAAAQTPPPPVEIGVNATRTKGGPDGGPTITINGTANLPDGALVSYEVSLPRCAALKCVKDGTIPVKGGTFTKTVKIPWTIESAASPAEVWVAFQTVVGTSKHQPKAVIKAYGKAGENMTGDQVVDAGGLHRAEVTVDLPDEGSL